VRRPEKETRPKLFYKGAHQATLDPLAARRPDGGLFMWSEQGKLKDQVTSGHPGAWNSSASAVLSYDIPHRMPWDWRVSLYTWTKGIATGAYLVPLLLCLVGVLPWSDPLWLVTAPIVAGIFLAATGGLLIWDLEHPERFFYIFTRPHWKSWLVRGGFIIAAFSLILMLHFLGGLAGSADVAKWLALLGAPLAIGTAAYTAYLFAQSKARDLWQNPLSPAHMVVQAVLLGAAIVSLLAAPVLLRTDAYAGDSAAALGNAALWLLGGASLLHLLLLLGEATLTHVTAHARLAAWEMARGRFRWFYVAGIVLVGMSIAAPWQGAWTAIPALLGILAWEHAYVQAGQSVPLA
jgi:formate-dependent nitrite reductase membrane component NrfD